MIEKWPQALEAAIYALTSALDESRRGSKIARFLAPSAPLLPYCLHPVDDEQTLIWLNRAYKPLGVMTLTREWVRYAEYPWLHVAPSDPRISRLLTIHCQKTRVLSGGMGFFLFGDRRNNPYQNKDSALQYLAQLRGVLECSPASAPPAA